MTCWLKCHDVASLVHHHTHKHIQCSSLPSSGSTEVSSTDFPSTCGIWLLCLVFPGPDCGFTEAERVTHCRRNRGFLNYTQPTCRGLLARFPSKRKNASAAKVKPREMPTGFSLEACTSVRQAEFILLKRMASTRFGKCPWDYGAGASQDFVGPCGQAGDFLSRLPAAEPLEGFSSNNKLRMKFHRKSFYNQNNRHWTSRNYLLDSCCAWRGASLIKTDDFSQRYFRGITNAKKTPEKWFASLHKNATTCLD